MLTFDVLDDELITQHTIDWNPTGGDRLWWWKKEVQLKNKWLASSDALLQRRQTGFVEMPQLINQSFVVKRSLMTTQWRKACLGIRYLNQTADHHETEGPEGWRLFQVKADEKGPSGVFGAIHHCTKSDILASNTGTEGRQARNRTHIGFLPWGTIHLALLMTWETVDSLEISVTLGPFETVMAIRGSREVQLSCQKRVELPLPITDARKGRSRCMSFNILLHNQLPADWDERSY